MVPWIHGRSQWVDIGWELKSTCKDWELRGSIPEARSSASHHILKPETICSWLLERVKETGQKVNQSVSCSVVSYSLDRSPPGSFVHGILQASILEWVAIPSPGDLPDPRIELRSPALQADCLPLESPLRPGATQGRIVCTMLDVPSSSS